MEAYMGDLRTEKKTREGRTWISVTGCDREAEAVEIPGEQGGFSVEEIGEYAFRDCALEEIILPETLRKIGRYAFYNCQSLERITLSDTLSDIGSGAFTGCHRVRLLEVRMEAGERSALQALLSEFAEALEVRLFREGRRMTLYFPPYFEQGVENTPARIIVTRTYGSGLKYRNCFVNRRLSLSQYDRQFPWAREEEDLDFLIRLALARLLWPEELGGKARTAYEDFLREKGEEALKLAIREQREEAFLFLTEQLGLSPEICSRAAAWAAEQGKAGAVSRLMRQSRQGFKTAGGRKFDLDEI